MTLDESLQRLTDLRAASLAVLWEQADVLAEMLPAPQRGKKAPGVGLAAHHLVCSAAWVRRFYKVGKTFPNGLLFPDGTKVRNEELPFVLYLACLRRPDPLKVLKDALEHGHSAADLDKKESGPPCPTCGKRMRAA